MGRRSTARTRLVSAGDRLFRDQGFGTVGVAQLCAAASVNKGSFYHFFSSKRTLLLEVVDRSWDETGMIRRWESDIPDRPVAALRTFLEELFAYHYADRESVGRVRGSLVGNIALELAGADTEVEGQVTTLLRRETTAFESVLRRALEIGEVSLSNPAHTAQTLVACLQGLLMLARVQNDLSLLPAAETGLLRLIGVSGQP